MSSSRLKHFSLFQLYYLWLIFSTLIILSTVYQVAIVVQNILPADLSLKHLLFHLAHQGGKIILPPTLYPLTSATEFAVTLHTAFMRAVAAEKDYNTQLQKAQQVAARRRAGLDVGDSTSNNAPGLVQSLSLAGLYSPFSGAGGDLQGPQALQASVEAFVDQSRGEELLRFVFFVLFQSEGNASVRFDFPAVIVILY